MKCALEKIAEEKIREAIEKGDLDDLPERGSPLDLSDYFKNPPHLRIAYHLLKTSGFLPREVELLREINVLKEKRRRSDDDLTITKLTASINFKTTQLRILLERNRRPR